ncbi:MAG: hypothetical protein ACJ75J_03025 [Cytophagaceae bacterium]
MTASVSGLIVLAVSIYMFVHFFLTPLVKHKIITSVHKSSGGLYSMHMDDFGLRFWTGAFYMEKVHLVQDTAVLARLRKEDPSANLSDINITISELSVSRIWWENFILNRSLKVGRINIDRPEFTFKAKTPEDTLKVGKESFLDVLPGIIASFAGSLKIEEIRVKQGILHYDVQGSTGLTTQNADSIFLDMKNIEIDTSTSNKALYTNDVHFGLRNYTLTTPDQLYKLQIGHIKGSYADSMLNISSIKLEPTEKQKVKDHYNLFIKEISTTGIDFSLFFKANKVSLGTMKIDGPSIDLLYHMTAKKTSADTSGKSGSKMDMLATAFRYIANTFLMDRFMIVNGNFNSTVISADGTSFQKASNLMLTLDSIRIDTVTLKDGNYWKSLQISLTDLEAKLASQNLKLSVKSLNASSEQSDLNLKGVVIAQLHASEKGEQMYFKDFIKSIELKGIDYHRLLYGKGISMKQMDINEMKVEIFNNEAAESRKASYGGQMPNELISSIPTYLNIEHFNINNAYFKYQDQSPDVKDPGILTFENTTLNISNLTNDKAKNNIKTPAILKGSTKVMGKGLLKLDIRIPLMSSQFNCHVNGSLGEIEGKYFNSFLEYGGMRLESGTIEAQNFNINVVNGKASGDMLLLYHDLNAKIVEKKTGKVKHLFSHVANFVLKNDNKDKNKKNDELKAPKTVPVAYTRKTEDDFLTYIWSSISTSIVDTVVKDFFQPLVPQK